MDKILELARSIDALLESEGLTYDETKAALDIALTLARLKDDLATQTK